jgi:hypothetical protein
MKSSMFYMHDLCTKFSAPKFQTQKPALWFLAPKFCMKNARKNIDIIDNRSFAKNDLRPNQGVVKTFSFAYRYQLNCVGLFSSFDVQK